MPDNDALIAYLNSGSEKYSFTPEAFAKIDTLIELYGGVELIDASHDDTDDGLGAYITYIIKDMMTFAGYHPKTKAN